jgi:HD superfamily phosphohydrolase YqeK
MCAVASTEAPPHNPAVVSAAARGELPDWAQADDARREHMQRVATVLADWADRLGLPAAERERWLAAAWLHDSLRDADPAALRPDLPPALAALPDPLVHGPAVAERLKHELDPALADAIRYHTFGHPALDRLGRALYLADFLEPGRDFLPFWRAELRGRVPAQLDAVLVEVLAVRITHLLERRKPIRPETAAFWSSLVGTER